MQELGGFCRNEAKKALSEVGEAQRMANLDVKENMTDKKGKKVMEENEIVGRIKDGD